MKFVYFVTRGSDDATGASIPWHLAVNGSVEVGHETSIVLGGDATDVIIGDTAEKIEGVGVPPMRELLAKVRERQVPVYV
jgi:predicted peroxiredoxin